ncbi:GtrA family protein [Chitiniphilus shinanonensis]|uniref:GtrA family protein n=1 Tax=Chitiniphilus shinanonensis TaxID=553088 RepID=UPI003342620D
MVGVASNALGYGLYLLLAFGGISPMRSMTCVYLASATLAFWGNRNFTFRTCARNMSGEIFRYIVAHAIGYSTNYLILFFFYEKLKFAHEIVQAVSVFVVALVLFCSFKFFVFPKKP